MGFYLDCHRDFDKADYLRAAFDALEIPAPVFDLTEDPPHALPSFIACLPPDRCLVCVVEHDTHDAAGIAFDDRELAHILRSVGGGKRPCRWFLMRKTDAALNCPRYAAWLANGPSPDAQRQAGEN